jgi:sterol desaturase/sphingolipid hydroxylase (fatty acid hydroxylase superfamily)
MPILQAIVALLFGVLVFSLVEYVHHRIGGHARLLGDRLLASHRSHHRDAREGGVAFAEKLRQRAPLVLGVTPFFALGFVMALGASSGALATLGLVGGYVYSEWFHHRMHHRVPQSALARWLWRHHYLHHYADGRVNFGFTSPLWDVVFGTLRVSESVRIPSASFPEWPDGVPGFTVMRAGEPHRAARSAPAPSRRTRARSARTG